jgi:tRNA-intron endonuclease
MRPFEIELDISVMDYPPVSLEWFDPERNLLSSKYLSFHAARYPIVVPKVSGMIPYLKGKKIIVEDEKTASTLQNKGSFGEPLSGGGSELTLIEGAYLLESGRIEIKRSRKGRNADLPFVLKRGLSDHERFMENFLVFRDLRNRGLVAQGNGRGCWNSFPRGKRPGVGKADTWITVFREDDLVSPRELWIESITRFNMKMKAVAAVVDSDWDITYYTIRTALNEKEAEMSERSTGSASSHKKISRIGISHGGALLIDGDIDEIHEEGVIGTRLGSTLLISRDEDRITDKEGKTKRTDRDRIYDDIMSRGWLARTGFKYGAHFRVYTRRSMDDHSRFLVQAVDENARFTWEELSRPLRLSHSVRKRFLFGFFPKDMGEPYYDGKGPVYLEMEWFRP